mgnify:CR=1 FL=1
MERKVVTDLSVPEADKLHDRLSHAGFRRSHGIAYAPVCQNCNACVPIRLPVARLQPDRTQRKIMNRNADIGIYRVPAQATEEQFVLFQHYQAARHQGGDMASMTFADYRSMIEETPVDTFMLEFRRADGELLVVSLIDRLGDGLSAVYTFFQPSEERRSLGTYAVLCLASCAASMSLSYVYLGYWIAESRKMAYKTRFQPVEILLQGVWRNLDEASYGKRVSSPQTGEET